VFAIAAIAFLGYATALGSELTIAYLIIYGTVAALSIAARRQRHRTAAAALTANTQLRPRPSERPRRSPSL